MTLAIMTACTFSSHYISYMLTSNLSVTIAPLLFYVASLLLLSLPLRLPQSWTLTAKDPASVPLSLEPCVSHLMESATSKAYQGPSTPPH